MTPTRTIETLLIANRGEIAVRIARTCRRLGIRTVAVFTEPDQGWPHVRAADVAAVVDDYLDMDSVLEAARRTGADAIHPGYGFLAENAIFAQKVVDAGLVWVGPPAGAIAAMGDKAAARRKAQEVGVPVIPGYDAEDDSDEALVRAARDIGYPLMVKAAAGGGGKGMAVVRSPDQLGAALAGARRIARSAFGSDRLILERFLERPRHIEAQVIADEHGQCLNLLERECSIQRRHQKVIEEAPSPAFRDEAGLARRRALLGDAVRLSRAVGYTGAGTVEFLLDESGKHYFLEMNTRLQVEHPVTELITGLDIVELQLEVAEGRRLRLSQDEVPIHGHAMEARLYAEDPDRDYLPQAGRVLRFDLPRGRDVRVDAGVEAGTEVGIRYDPMLAKIIAWGEDREAARRRLARALEESVVLGPKTNRSWMGKVLRHPQFREGKLWTGFLDEHASAFAPRPDEPALQRAVVVAAVTEWEHDRQRRGRLPGLRPGWRNNHWPEPPRVYEVSGQVVAVTLFSKGDVLEVRSDRWNEHNALPGISTNKPSPLLPDTLDVQLISDGADPILEFNGVRRQFAVGRDGDRIVVQEGRSTVILTRLTDLPFSNTAEELGGCAAPMPGRVVRIDVKEGQQVQAGDTLVVLEAMKMEQPVRAPQAGIISAVRVEVGVQVDGGQSLVTLEVD